jgi:hypothetical protein
MGGIRFHCVTAESFGTENPFELNKHVCWAHLEAGRRLELTQVDLDEWSQDTVVQPSYLTQTHANPVLSPVEILIFARILGAHLSTSHPRHQRLPLITWYFVNPECYRNTTAIAGVN